MDKEIINNENIVSNNDNKEITNQDLMDMLTVLVERTNKISVIEKKMDKEFKGIQDRLTKLELDNENEIKPDLQAIRENQTEVINQKSHFTEVETKVDEVKDDVDVLKIVVTEHSATLEELKKRA